MDRVRKLRRVLPDDIVILCQSHVLNRGALTGNPDTQIADHGALVARPVSIDREKEPVELGVSEIQGGIRTIRVSYGAIASRRATTKQRGRQVLAQARRLP